MRYRSNPADDHHKDGRPNRDARHHDKNQLQNQVIQLKRLIRMQNQVIIGLSSCFAIVIISTMLLIQHLPHPNDEHGPFWETNVAHLHEENTKKQLNLKRQHKETPSIPTAAVAQSTSICSHYGCPIRPVEMSQLENTTHSFIASSNHIILTHKSNRKKPAPVNQDRAVLIPSFGDDFDRTDMITNPRGKFFVGMFDGHDDHGHDVAQFSSDEIPSRIASEMHNITNDPSNRIIEREQMKQIITRTFIEVDRDVPLSGGGSTAIVMLRRGNTLYMANTGDSTSFIMVYHPPSKVDEEKATRNEEYVSSPRSPTIQLHLQGTVAIHHVNEKHKAHFPTEQSRIESLGGKVHIPPKNPMGSRVIARSALHREDVGLAMSRSIGDWEWTAIGVIPDPDVVVLDLGQFWSENKIEGGAKVVAVAGSDGLFDARRVEFVANHLAYGLFEDRSPNGGDGRVLANRLINVGKKLVEMASPLKEEWYRDDITFIAKVIEL